MKTSIRTMILTSACWAALAAPASMPGALAAEPSEATAISGFASPTDPPAFDTPDEAVDAFKAALVADDFNKLAALLGLDAAKLKADEGVMDTYAQIRDGAKRKVVVRDIGGSKILDIGDRLWPLPFPVVKGEDGKWSFDTYVGFQEIINRRVGENELQAIATLRAYVDAQRDYASEDHDGDGVLEFARKLISSDGQTDGLYWSPELGAGPSPAGEALENGATLSKARAGEGYYGYHYRIIESQGANIAGGKFGYVINGNMIAGFALIAWPVRYNETGVHTFEVNANGTVYQADLGEKTDSMAAAITQFNPGDAWDVTDD